MVEAEYRFLERGPVLPVNGVLGSVPMNITGHAEFKSDNWA